MRVLALAVAALALAGCGGRGADEDPDAALDRAVERTQAAQSYVFTLEVADSDDTTARGKGAIDLERKRGWITYTFEGTDGEGPMGIELRYLDGKTYTRFDDDAGLHSWFAEDGDGFVATLPFGATTEPDKALARVRELATSVEALGEEDVDGVEAVHYRAVVPAGDFFAADQDPENAEETRSDLRAAGVEDVPVELWVDGDGLLRKIHVAFSFEDEGKPHRIGMTMGLSDFGAPVEVEAPPASAIDEFPVGVEESGPCDGAATPHRPEAVAKAMRAEGWEVSDSCDGDVTTIWGVPKGSTDDGRSLWCVVGPKPDDELRAPFELEEIATVEDGNVLCGAEAPADAAEAGRVFARLR